MQTITIHTSQSVKKYGKLNTHHHGGYPYGRVAKRLNAADCKSAPSGSGVRIPLLPSYGCSLMAEQRSPKPLVEVQFLSSVFFFFAVFFNQKALNECFLLLYKAIVTKQIQLRHEGINIILSNATKVIGQLIFVT